MLKNYFKIAIAVLKRRKFFTFISLFGISFTLAIIIIVAAFTDFILSSGYPDTNRDRELFVTSMHFKSTKTRSNINGGPSFYYIDHYVTKLKTPEKVAVYSNNNPTNSYINNKKFVNSLKYTNAQFWDVLQFNFIEGKPYSKQQLDNAEKVTVITDYMRNNYFGEGSSALGKYIETDNVQYRVIGVVKTASVASHIYADVYLPYTLSKEDLHYMGLGGDYSAILLLHSKDDIDKMKEEYNQMAAKVPINDKEFDEKFTFADTYIQSFSRSFEFGDGDGAGLTTLFLICGTILLLFMLLPTLNLVNINISRILDRSSEIGVRKAFGASSQTLVYQFVVENLILTFLGGTIGIVLSFIAIQVINTSDMDGIYLSINFNVLLVTLFMCIVFGLLSGVYPAWRMSRLHVVTALKAQ